MKTVQWEPSCSMRKEGQRDCRTDGHDEANRRFSQFCKGASKQFTGVKCGRKCITKAKSRPTLSRETTVLLKQPISFPTNTVAERRNDLAEDVERHVKKNLKILWRNYLS